MHSAGVEDKQSLSSKQPNALTLSAFVTYTMHYFRDSKLTKVIQFVAEHDEL
jgi:hypothetical protein